MRGNSVEHESRDLYFCRAWTRWLSSWSCQRRSPIMTTTVGGATDGKLALRFERDVTPLIPGLYQRAVRITNSRADAEDLLQETMFKAYRAFHTFQEGTYLSAWLHRIMTNTNVNGYRAQQRRPAQCWI